MHDKKYLHIFMRVRWERIVNIAMLNWGAFDFMSGVKMYIVNLAQSLASRGNQVYVVTSDDV